MDDLKKITEVFYALCNKYQELTKEYNLSHPDDKRNEYFKYQFPNSYDKLMYAFTLVPSFEKLPELAKLFKNEVVTNSELLQTLIADGVNTIYQDNEEYTDLCKMFMRDISNVYESIIEVKDYKMEYLYLYQKLLAESNINENLKKNILDHIIYLMTTIKKYIPLDKISSEKELNKHSTLPAYNEDEPDKYYQLFYNIKDINLGGCDLDYFKCPLHKLQPNNKNINVQNINDINNIQISRGSNKKLLSDKNNFKVQYLRNLSYDNKDIKKYYTIGDKMNKEDIKNEMKKITDKYSKNGVFDIKLMSNTLCDKMLDIYTNLPSASALTYFDYLDTSGNTVANPYVLFAFDKEIDDLYFEGKISYFANCCLALSHTSNININDPVCSEYIFTMKELSELKYNNYTYAAYYLMVNYLLENYTKWFSSIKSKLGIDEEGVYHREKDIIRAKAVSENRGEKYDKYMKINYLRLFTNDLSQEYEEYYNIFKTFSVCFEKFLSLSLTLNKDIEKLQIKNTTIGDILSDIKSNKQSYSNNTFLNSVGIRHYFNDILINISSNDIIHSFITILETIRPTRILEYFTNNGIESIFNDVTYYYFFKQNHCNKCYENLLDFIVNGFYDIFKEINIYREYYLYNIDTKLIYDILEPKHFVDETAHKQITYEYELGTTLSTFEYYYSMYYYDKNKANYLEECYLTEGSEVVIYDNKKYIKVIITNSSSLSPYRNPGTYKVATKYNNIFNEGCKFKSDSEFIKNTIIYKTIFAKPSNIGENKPYMIITEEENNYHALNVIKNNKIYTYNDSPSINMNGTLYHDDSITTSNKLYQLHKILYTNYLDNNYISKCLIKRNENYLYHIENLDKLKKILAKCSNCDFIVSTNVYELKCKANEIVGVNKNNITTLKVGTSDTEAQQLLDDKYKLLPAFDTSKTNIKVMYENKIMFDNNLSNTIPVILREGDTVYYNGGAKNNDNGYVLIKNENNKYVALVITNLDKFKCIDEVSIYNRNNIYKSLSQISFYYDFNDLTEGMLKSSLVDISNLNLDDSYLIINEKQISDVQGTKLNEDLLVYCNSYYINNVNMKILEKDVYKVNPESNTLQKEFSVKDFNKLMLRKCFPDNFKRTLIINQDVLDAIDGGKYSVPNIKIKEALYEYGKYPIYLEHYFMTNRVEYKLKGKFNIRCLAKLSTLPDATKYLDTNELNYQIKEVLIQGEDMIIKEGKIQSSGDVYLVGIELSNDHMFRVPASKITNKGLLNVIDFQQFNNIYDRVELYLDDFKLTDFIVKPLTLETIGTMKNMKYINYY